MLRLQDIPQEAESRTGLQGSFSINLKIIYNTARCLPPLPAAGHNLHSHHRGDYPGIRLAAHDTGHQAPLVTLNSVKIS